MNVALIMGSAVSMSRSKLSQCLGHMKSSMMAGDKFDVFVQFEQGGEVAMHADLVEFNLSGTQFAKIDEES